MRNCSFTSPWTSRRLFIANRTSPAKKQGPWQEAGHLGKSMPRNVNRIPCGMEHEICFYFRMMKILRHLLSFVFLHSCTSFSLLPPFTLQNQYTAIEQIFSESTELFYRNKISPTWPSVRSTRGFRHVSILHSLKSAGESSEKRAIFIYSDNIQATRRNMRWPEFMRRSKIRIKLWKCYAF